MNCETQKNHYLIFPVGFHLLAVLLHALPKGTLKEDIPLATSIKELAKLSNVSSLEKTYHILHEDDRELSCILKNCLTAPAAPKETSESE